MNRKQIIFLIGFVAMGLFLAACGAPPPTPKINDAVGTEIVATFMAQITQTAAAAGTPTPTESAAVQEETEEPDIFDELETAEASVDLDVTPTPGAYQALLSHFRFVTVSDGNLYVRDGMGLPKQITQSGTDHDPIISPDGQKIVFYRGEKFDNVFLVNADGSNEQAIINKKLLSVLGDGQVEFLTFRPKTYDLIFSSHVCDTSACDASIFLAGSKLTEVAKATSSLDDPLPDIPKFAVSADGKYLSVVTVKQMDLYNLDGKVAPSRIMGLPIAGWQFQYWMPDSNDLISLVYMDRAYTVSHYKVGQTQAKEITFRPVIRSTNLACSFSISPDRNWILYRDLKRDGYLGSLKDMQVQPYAWVDDCAIKWSPDSRHFASQTEIGSVDGAPSIKLEDAHFITWLDATHYLFSKGKSIIELQTYIAEVGKEADAVQVDFLWSAVYAVVEPTPAP